MVMEKAKNILLKIIPYIVLLIATLLGNYLYFYNGLNLGDDFKFHFGNIQEIYKLLNEGKPISEISGYIGMGLGSGTRLFYAPIPHYIVALMAFILNISVISSYKLVMFILIFISGVFMYRFALSITNNRRVISLISALAFTLYPYRGFDMYHRIAVAEAFAITFLPLFFMGLYHITHLKDKVNVLGFVEVIIGGALLYLSHNITAVFAYIIGVLYLLFNIKNIILLMKQKRYLVYCFSSVVLLVFIISVSFVTQFELMATDLYNVTNSKIMWTDIESVIDRTSEQFIYSGFLNVYSLTYNYPELFDKQTLIYGVIAYICSCLAFVIIDGILKEKIKKKYIHLIISIPILFVLISIIERRIETYFGATIFVIAYLCILFFKDNDENTNSNERIYKDVNFYYVILSLIICYVLMEFGSVWKVLPSALLNIQFPWRLWALVQLLCAMLVAILLKYLNYKKALSFIICVLVSMFLVCNQAIIDNRASYTYNLDSNWAFEINDTYLDSPTAMGFNKEYLPQIYFDSNYKSNYKNSIFNKVKYKIFYDSSKIEDYYYKPVVLEGNSNIEVIESFADKHTINVSSEELTLIQMPMFYYKGYSVSAINTNTNEKTELEVINVDGFVSFAVDKGKYIITTNYEGTTLRKTSIVCCVFGSSITLLALIYGIIEKRKRNKQRNLQNIK